MLNNSSFTGLLKAFLKIDIYFHRNTQVKISLKECRLYDRFNIYGTVNQCVMQYCESVLKSIKKL